MSTAVPDALLALTALAVVTIAVITVRAAPRAAFVAWALLFFFVPVWVGIAVGPFWAIITLATMGLLVVSFVKVPLQPADGWFMAFVVLVVGLLVVGGASLPDTVTALSEWVLPYAFGRVVLGRVSTNLVVNVLSIMAVSAASLAVLEFITSFNPFVLIPGSGAAHEDFSPLQDRGGVIRAEGAFGHSIALGAVLAMCSAFVVATRWQTAPKVIALGVIATATVLTFSRTGLITLVITLVVSVCLMPGVSARFRAVAVSAGIGAAAIAVPVLSRVLGAAGEEAQGSAGYRTDLLVLLREVQLFGNPGHWQSLVSGDYYLGYFARSIDNALVLMLLRFGVVPSLLLLSVITCAIVAAARPATRSPAALAVLGQLPSLVVVALITQYGMFLWFCVGLAVSWHQADRGAADGEVLGEARTPHKASVGSRG
ncbi:hypothetical protein [Brachybacterium sp. AOP29-B2-41]|uniref:hypothetical protein n=1 Tax=Brachybacterium sp. AOP29-B2-41 TaxID=3457704 RepID=UPI0040335139